MMEIWKDIKGYEQQYQISSMGRVRVIEHQLTDKRGRTKTIKPKLLCLHLDKKGYVRVRITGSRVFLVHRLVCQAFKSNPNNKPEVNHKDGNKTNNVVNNLEWVSRKENMLHAYDNMLHPHGERTHTSKLTEDDVINIRKLYEQGFLQKDIALMYGVVDGQISRIVNRHHWKHI